MVRYVQVWQICLTGFKHYKEAQHPSQDRQITSVALCPSKDVHKLQALHNMPHRIKSNYMFGTVVRLRGYTPKKG